MKIAEINMLTNGSTGKIMFQIAETGRARGDTVRTYSPVPFMRGKKNELKKIPDHFWWGCRVETMFHYYAGTLLGANGLFSWFGTHSLIKELKRFSPDVVHLHNLHSFCINLPMLFRYIKRSNVPVVWTLHDCWTFTGHCPYFSMVGCNQWEKGCHNCPQPRVYPKMYLDTSKRMYALKKKWFCGVENMTLVTPSEWLADLTKQSFLKSYPVKVINNGIDLNVFRPTPSNFREHHGIPQDKYILLGVAFGWSARKGLDVFVELAKRLDSRYQIVLVGTDERVDTQLPSNIISIHRTQNQKELAEIYTAADLFVNPTREENYPTVNMESIACGTPVLTFKTGGSPEIPDSLTGAVVECDDIDNMEREIIRITGERVFREEDCLKRAANFDGETCFAKCVELFNSIYESEKD